MIAPLTFLLLLPFLGTAIGAAGVFFLRKELSRSWNQALSGYSAGVMTASAIWSLFLPAIEQCGSMLPVIVGIWAGFLFLIALERSVVRLHSRHVKSLLFLAITLHNIPEGIAVGIVAANWIHNTEPSAFFSALGVTAGIALQNIPEGAIVSTSLRSDGESRSRAFGWGVFSGVVEPLGSLFALILATFILPVLPYFLGLAGGAMLYVVIQELIPEMHDSDQSRIGAISFAAGFTTMAFLDGYFG